MNIEEILKRIERTGGNINESLEDYMSTCLSLSEDEFDELNDSIGIDMFCLQYDITFITIKREGEINFVHYSNPNNEDSIKKIGLINMDSEWIMDLGQGTYVIAEDNYIAEDNLLTYLSEKDNVDELLKVTGVYNGPYEECVYGVEHEGYILILHDIKPEDLDTEVVSCEEVFLKVC